MKIYAIFAIRDPESPVGLLEAWDNVGADIRKGQLL